MKEDETDQAIEEPDDIMHIIRDIENDFPVICYTDGGESDGRVSFAFVAFKSGVDSKHFQFRIRDERTVFVAELLCLSSQVIYSQFGLAIHHNDHQARRRFVEWAQNEIAVVPDFHKRILFSDEAQFWLNGYVNKQNCRILSEANPQVYVETPLHSEKLTVWCAL
ncbi:DUF4817 domain-containing protein [Trichonephila clavipes]|nr:DUF4817 domain-containing protein [Trichonephila clavipes]